MVDLPKKIVIFASGRGSNAEKIITYFKDRKIVSIAAVFSNNKNAKVLEMAHEKGVKTVAFTRKDFYETDRVITPLKDINPNLIVLAGFMWMVPKNIIAAFPKRIINIHPALLPKYGGKGMYGKHVHEAVLAHKEKETGISIHYINEHYDEGRIIAQFKVSIEDDTSVDAVIKKVRTLEHKYYAKVIDQLLLPE